MSIKKLERIAVPPAPHFVGDGFRVHNFIPSYPGMDMERMDPFIMMDYNAPYHFSPSDTPRGVGVHPHRGFETVTIAYQGKVAHHDSAGGGGIIGEGDIQWMTAASGVLHKEYHEKEFSKRGGMFQMVQLWVNLPAKDKMSRPKYQAISKEEMGSYQLAQNQGKIEVIAGHFQSIEGPASTFSPVHMMNAHLNKEGKANFSFPEHYNTIVLAIKGTFKINDDEIIGTNQLGLFENKGEQFSIEAMEDSIALVLSGEPLNEPIAAHGPFVMNTQKEIVQAFDDYNKGKFGFLED